MRNLWSDEEARGLEGIDLLVYRSHLIGSEEDLVLRGGGNTSLKQVEADFRGRAVRVLRIKGSGSDLRTITAKDFAAVRLDDVEPLLERREMSDEEMVDDLARCLLEPGSPRPSIETLLHAFLPHPHVDHTHADAILVLTNNADGRRHVQEAFGGDAAFVPYRRPGFRLSREVAEAARARAGIRCVVLEKHGLITWGATAKEAYDATIELNTRAEEYARDRARGRRVLGAVAPPLEPAGRRRVALRILPWLRGLLSGRRADRAPGDGAPSIPAERRVVLCFDDGADVLEFAGSEAGPQIALSGPATPDHLLYTRPRPLVVTCRSAAPAGSDAWIAGVREAAAADLGRWVDDYSLYVRKNGTGSETVGEPYPRVVLLPGVGMFTAWKDAAHARLVATIMHHSIGVMRGAQAIGEYRSLSLKDCFDVEYWPLELYRMSLAPAEKDLARRVALVTGAGGGLGRAIARRLAAEGCHVVATDVAFERVQDLARELEELYGAGRALPARLDVTDEADVRAAFEAAVLAYGGLDIVVSNAGIAHVSPIETMDLRDWQRCLAVNATGHFLVAREAVRILKEQGTGGSLIFVASKNVLAPGKDFGAYSASKAAEVQLARILAIEGGEHGIRANIINPDAVFQDSGLWSPGVREERARAHGIAPADLEDFYRRRNLLKVRVTAEDVAEAALWLAGDRSAKTTGCILTTDGGVREAFPR